MKTKYIIFGIVFIAGGILGWGISHFGRSEKETHSHLVSEEETIWTCSMHPQIRRTEPGKCPICEMDLIPVDDSGNSSGKNNPLQLTMTQSAVELANIQTTQVGSSVSVGDAADPLFLNGRIQVDERKVFSQTAHFPGRIEKLNVKFAGEYVEKGNVIGEVYSPEIITAQQELLEAKKLLEVNPDLIKVARNKLRFLKVSQEFINNVETRGVVIETLPIIAEESGYVLSKDIEEGDYISSSQVLFKIYNLSSLWAVFDIYEENLSSFSVGDRIRFKVQALPGKEFTTRVDFIDPVLDPATRAVKVRGQVINSGGLLKPEMLIRGTLQSSKNKLSEESLYVPKTAVLWTGRSSVVYLRDKSQAIPTFEYREIELGDVVGSSYQVKNGLQAGDQVVTNGVFAVDASAQLNNQRSMINQSVKVKGDQVPENIHPDFSGELDKSHRESLDNVIDQYLDFKDKLVADDKDNIPGTIETIISGIDRMPEADISQQWGEVWNEFRSELEASAKRLPQVNSIEEWRAILKPLSETLIAQIKTFGNPETGTVYIQHCPMADDDQGANWLSVHPDIENPYFGEKMLKCGSTTDSLLPIKELKQ